MLGAGAAAGGCAGAVQGPPSGVVTFLFTDVEASGPVAHPQRQNGVEVRHELVQPHPVFGEA